MAYQQQEEESEFTRGLGEGGGRYPGGGKGVEWCTPSAPAEYFALDLVDADPPGVVRKAGMCNRL